MLYLLVAGLLTACSPDPGAVTAAVVQETGGQTQQQYSELVAGLETRLRALEEELATSAGARATGPARRLFEGWLYHARLTGNLASFDRAAAALTELETRSRGQPPCREQAELALALHRIEAAATALQSCQVDSRDLQIDIDYYQGRYRTALAGAIALLNERNLPVDYVRLARLRQGTGSSREADALLEAAEQRYHNDNPHQIAWFRLQRGILALERAEYERARALFHRADEALPGWWLVEEHLAETAVLLGQTGEAVALYDGVIAATGDPQFIAARAEIDLSLGRENAAQEGISLARRKLNERLQQHPAALTGHAVDFYLSHGPLQKALELARQNYDQRPYGAAATRLATALRMSGQTAEALDLLGAEIERGWASAEALAELSLIRSELASAMPDN